MATRNNEVPNRLPINVNYEAYMRRKYMKPAFRKQVREAVKGIRNVKRKYSRAEIENMYNRSKIINKNLEKAIRNNRNVQNMLFKSISNAAKEWAANATKNAELFDPVKYKKYRQYYISELNRAAGFAARNTFGARVYSAGRGLRASAVDFLKRRDRNIRRAARLTRDAKIAATKAARLQSLKASSLFNRPVARGVSLATRLRNNQSLPLRAEQLKGMYKTEATKYNNLLKRLQDAKNAKERAAQLNAQANLERNLSQVNGAAAALALTTVGSPVHAPAPPAPITRRNSVLGQI